MLLILLPATRTIPIGRLKVRSSDILAIEKIHSSLFVFSQRERVQTIQAPSLHLAICDVDEPAIKHMYRLHSRWEFPCQCCNAVPYNGAEQMTGGLVRFPPPPPAPAAAELPECEQPHGSRAPPRERPAAAQRGPGNATRFSACSSCTLQGQISALLDPTLPEQVFAI